MLKNNKKTPPFEERIDLDNKKETSQDRKLFWVGIGASAGGLEALRTFVATLPKKKYS